MTKERAVISFNDFKETCENYQKICELEGIIDQDTFENFYRNRVYFGFPQRKEKFRLIHVPGMSEWVAIDYGLADVIEYLNQKGYITKYCCSGHKFDKYTSGYIYFAALDKEKQATLLDLAFGLTLSGQMYVKVEVPSDDEIIIRFRPNVPNEDNNCIMLEAIRRAVIDFI